MNELLCFIKSNPNNYKELLSKEPYCLSFNEDDNYILLKYNQIKSDFKNLLVRQARGCIIKKSTLEYVCVPFYKFFNIYEENCDKIDFKSVKVYEKMDGSIMKLWYDDGEWRLYTNGCIDAKNAKLNSLKYNNFYDYFFSLFDKSILNNLSKSNAYMFELCGKENKVVVSHDVEKIYHIGTRNNLTLFENNFYIGIEQPKKYELSDIQEIKEFVETFDSSHEGFVLVDDNWNRAKVKSSLYVSLHHIASNHNITYEDIYEIISKNEEDEFLSYFPEYKEHFNKVNNIINNIVEEINKINHCCYENRKLNKKEYALLFKDNKYSKYCFLFYNSVWKNEILDMDQILRFYILQNLKNLI